MRIMVLYYSMTGNMYKLAKAVSEGAGEVEAAEVLLRTVPELIPEDKWNDSIRKAKELQKDVPIATLEELASIDGLVFGTPTRFGNMVSQLKNFIDQTGRIWVEGKLIGKPLGVFTGSAMQHGGQETTIISSMIPFIHHGMIYVGVPTSERDLAAVDEVQGGSFYGASAVVGPMAQDSPKDSDLRIAKALGKRVAEIARKLKK